MLDFTPFRLDPINHQLWRDDVLVIVRPKPFAVLQHLVENPGRLLTYQEMRKAIWPDAYVSESVLRGYIRDLREVLGDDPDQPHFIETIPRRGYRFIGKVASSQHSVVSSKEEARDLRLEASPSSPQVSSLKPLVSRIVGRERDLAHLQRLFDKAMNGERQLVFVTGEPGIGKTTLVDTFVGEITAHDVFVVRGQCVEQYGRGEAYLPLLEALGRLCRQPGGEAVLGILRRFAPTWLVQMPSLLTDEELEPLQRKAQGVTRERMLREMAEALEASTTRACLVMVLEDLHWCDPSTVDLLSYVARRREPGRLFILGTYRPTDVVMSGHPLKAVKQDLQARQQCDEVQLSFLPQAAIDEYLSLRFPRQQFPGELSQFLAHSTDGNPLFLVNTLDHLVTREVVKEVNGQWQLMAPMEAMRQEIPDSVRQLIEQQVGRLSADEQRMLEAASVIGTTFMGVTVAMGLGQETEQIEVVCEGLAQRGQFLRALAPVTLANGVLTGCYEFCHALYQSVLYERLAVTQRIRLHRGIGQHLESTYGTRVGEIATELANHFEHGQDYERVVRYLQHAAENAVRRSAPQEAIAHATKALALLKTLPVNPTRVQQELGIQITLGTPLLMTKGYAATEVENVYARARELCEHLGETPLLFPALFGLFLFHLTRAQYTIAHELAEQLMRLAESAHDPMLLLGAHWALSASLLYLGRIGAAETQIQEVIALYDPSAHRSSFQLYGQDIGVCKAQGSWSVWLLGYPAQALQRANDALTLAQDLAHPFSLAFALHFVALLHQFRRESQAAQRQAEEAIAFANAQSFPFWLAMAMIIRGAELVEHSHDQEGIALMHQGLATHRALGADIGSTYWVGLLAEKYGSNGQPAEGLATLDEALALVEKSGERWWEAELYRLKGELTLAGVRDWGLGVGQEGRQKAKSKRQRGARDLGLGARALSPQAPSLIPKEVEAEAEGYFLKAIDIARQQQAKSLELRAVMSLVRLRQRQATHVTHDTQQAIRIALAEAHKMLSAVYNWFTEGFDTVDLQEAKALLTELEAAPKK